MDSNGCILIFWYSFWPTDQFRGANGPLIPHVWMCLTHSHRDVELRFVRTRTLDGSTAKGCIWKRPHGVLDPCWISVGSVGSVLCTCPKTGGRWEATIRKTHGFYVGGCWGYPPWCGLLAIRMILFCLNRAGSTSNGETAFCMQFLQQFPANQRSLHKGTFFGVFYFKIEAHLQSPPKNVGQVATFCGLHASLKYLFHHHRSATISLGQGSALANSASTSAWQASGLHQQPKRKLRSSDNFSRRGWPSLLAGRDPPMCQKKHNSIFYTCLYVYICS